MDNSNTEWWKMPVVWGAAGLIAGFLIGGLVGWQWQRAAGETTNGDTSMQEEEGAMNSGSAMGEASVTVATQSSGLAVLVANASLPTTSWIAVHEMIDGEGTGNVLGAARRDAGEHENIVINLLRGTEPEREYAIVLYADNGNREFDLNADLPITNEDGAPVLIRFMTEFPSNPAGR